jgi:diguanylate cyclase (GGDEF)-like protein
MLQWKRHAAHAHFRTRPALARRAWGTAITGYRAVTAYNISQSDLQAAALQLQQAIHYHQEWYAAIMKALVCRATGDNPVAAPHGHRECAFAKWYCSELPEGIRSDAGFIALEATHRRMHQRANVLLGHSNAGNAIAPADYDGFVDSLQVFQSQLQSLSNDLTSEIGNLDPLTGAHNRIGMLAWLREQQELVRRGVFACSISMIDLDRFKTVNDTYGHMVGDRVLEALGRYMLKRLRPYDRLYRFGGEEFLVCTPETDLATCAALVERLREGFAATPIICDGIPIQCELSCGVAPLVPEVSVERSIERADKAMYAAKSSGRNCTRVWDTSMA